MPAAVTEALSKNLLDRANKQSKKYSEWKASMKEELRKKEMSECSFKPSLSARGRGSQSRSPAEARGLDRSRERDSMSATTEEQ